MDANKIKKAIIALVFFMAIFTSTNVFASAFCEGWQEGYVAGYCYRKYTCLEPLVPLCPLPKLGETTYQDGYNRGFLEGLNAKR